MLYAKGTRVRFLHTGDEGIVMGTLSDNMLNVRLMEDGIEIPAFIDDLQRIEEEDNSKKETAKVVRGKQIKEEKATIDLTAKTQYSILKSYGLQLAFNPILKNDASVDRFEMILINDTKYDCLFTLAFSLKGVVEENYNGKLPARSTFPVGEMYYDELNDAPQIEMECWRITTMGTGSRLHKKMKIKAKQFFKSIRTAPILNKQVHLFRIFEDLSDSSHEEDKSGAEDLRSYTKRAVIPKTNYYSDNLQDLGHEVEALANFSPELDLHVENLTANSSKLKSGEKLHLQLNAFDHYMNQAMQIGVERVFIIHGVGKGKLRDSIASHLIQMSGIVSFKNEYHPRYGFGATEVILK